MSLWDRLRLWWYRRVRGWKVIHFGAGKPYEKWIVCKRGDHAGQE